MAHGLVEELQAEQENLRCVINETKEFWKDSVGYDFLKYRTEYYGQKFSEGCDSLEGLLYELDKAMNELNELNESCCATDGR